MSMALKLPDFLRVISGRNLATKVGVEKGIDIKANTVDHLQQRDTCGD